MSGERPQAPRRARPPEASSSHSRPTGFASDVEDIPPDEVEEIPESEPPPTPLAALRREMLAGFGKVHAHIDHGRTADRAYLHEQITLVRRDAVQLREDLGLTKRDIAETKDDVANVKKTLPQKAAHVTGKAGNYLTLAVGALGLIAQAANLIDPKIAGPIQILLQLLQSVGVQ
jgi:hypothetical protein